MRTVIIFIVLISTFFLAYGKGTSVLPHVRQNLLFSHAAVFSRPEVTFDDTTSIFVESMKCTDSKARIGCVAGLVNAPIDRVWEIVTDYRNYAHLIPRCTHSMVLSPEIIPAISDSDKFPSSMDIADYSVECFMPRETTLIYSEIDIIFPVGRVRSILEVTSDSNDYTIYWRKLASDIRIHEGAWRFIPSGDQTIVVCVMRYRLNVWLPPFIIHRAVHNYFPRIITTLRQRVNEEP